MSRSMVHGIAAVEADLDIDRPQSGWRRSGRRRSCREADGLVWSHRAPALIFARARSTLPKASNPMTRSARPSVLKRTPSPPRGRARCHPDDDIAEREAGYRPSARRPLPSRVPNLADRRIDVIFDRTAVHSHRARGQQVVGICRRNGRERHPRRGPVPPQGQASRHARPASGARHSADRRAEAAAGAGLAHHQGGRRRHAARFATLRLHFWNMDPTSSGALAHRFGGPHQTAEDGISVRPIETVADAVFDVGRHLVNAVERRLSASADVPGISLRGAGFLWHHQPTDKMSDS